MVLAFAIIMMVSSAVISYFLVRQNEPIIAGLHMDVQANQTLIRDIWDNIAKKESRADTAILISLLAGKENKEAYKIREYYLQAFPELKSAASLLDILKVLEQDRRSNIESIDNMYLEQATIQNKIMSLKSSNKRYSDIAFFLQIFSLVLIIIKRDLIHTVS